MANSNFLFVGSAMARSRRMKMRSSHLLDMLKIDSPHLSAHPRLLSGSLKSPSSELSWKFAGTANSLAITFSFPLAATHGSDLRIRLAALKLAGGQLLSMWTELDAIHKRSREGK